MSLPQVFQHADREIRVVMLNDQPWWVAKDVCDVLGLTDSRKSVNLLDDDERNTIPVIDAMGREQETHIINEPGLYSLILRSRKPEAKEFKRWLTHEVLPAIRQTGKYVVQDTTPALPQDYKTALKALLAEVEQREKAEGKIKELMPKAVFHDKVAAASNCHTMDQAAKLLGTGRGRLFEWCYQNKILMRHTRLPYQCYIERGYFRIAEIPFNHPHTGEAMLSTKPLVTGKGLIWLAEKRGVKLPDEQFV